MSAFVPSSFTPSTLTSSFSGAALAARPRPRPSARRVIVAEAYSLDKYAAMSASPAPEPSGPSQPSAWWVMYRDSLKQRFSPFRAARDAETAMDKSTAAILAASTPYFTILAKTAAGARPLNADPFAMCTPLPKADRYMAGCVTAQYKMTACVGGVYNVKCTEGAVRGQAEEARVAAKAMEFKMKTRSTSAKFADFTETRRKAFIAAKGCTYEEALVRKYPQAARAVVTGGSEAKATCVRYAVGDDPVDKYMAACVDKQMKFKAVPMGVYDVMCADGTMKNMAEHRRVSSLAAKFRAGQMSKLAKEQLKYDAAKYARDYFGHGCDYEEELFNKYPAVSISMRPSFARY